MIGSRLKPARQLRFTGLDVPCSSPTAPRPPRPSEARRSPVRRMIAPGCPRFVPRPPLLLSTHDLAQYPWQRRGVHRVRLASESGTTRRFQDRGRWAKVARCRCLSPVQGALRQCRGRRSHGKTRMPHLRRHLPRRDPRAALQRNAHIVVPKDSLHQMLENPSMVRELSTPPLRR